MPTIYLVYLRTTSPMVSLSQYIVVAAFVWVLRYQDVVSDMSIFNSIHVCRSMSHSCSSKSSQFLKCDLYSEVCCFCWNISCSGYDESLGCHKWSVCPRTDYTALLIILWTKCLEQRGRAMLELLISAICWKFWEHELEGSKQYWKKSLRTCLACWAMLLPCLTVWLSPLLQTCLAWHSSPAVLLVMGGLFSAWLSVWLMLQQL